MNELIFVPIEPNNSLKYSLKKDERIRKKQETSLLFPFFLIRQRTHRCFYIVTCGNEKEAG